MEKHNLENLKKKIKKNLILINCLIQNLLF